MPRVENPNKHFENSKKRDGYSFLFNFHKTELSKKLTHVPKLKQVLNACDIKTINIKTFITDVNALLATPLDNTKQFDQLLAQNFILTFTLNLNLTQEEKIGFNSLLDQNQADLDTCLKSPIKSRFGSTNTRVDKLLKVKDLSKNYASFFTLKSLFTLKQLYIQDVYTFLDSLKNELAPPLPEPHKKKKSNSNTSDLETASETSDESVDRTTIEDLLDKSQKARAKHGQKLKKITQKKVESKKLEKFINTYHTKETNFRFYDSKPYPNILNPHINTNHTLKETIFKFELKEDLINKTPTPPKTATPPNQSYKTLTIPEKYIINQKKHLTNKFNLLLGSEKEFTITQTATGFNLKSWHLKRSHQQRPLGKGAYGEYHGDTFKNLNKEDVEFLILLPQISLENLDKILINPDLINIYFNQEDRPKIRLITDKAYARKKPHSTEKTSTNQLQFIKDIHSSDLFKKFGKGYTKPNFSKLLTTHNIIEVEEEIGFKHELPTPSKTYGIAPRARLDLYELSKKGPISFESLFNDLLKSFKLLHQLNIVHFDIKSDNVLHQNNTFKLTDFGNSSSNGSINRYKLNPSSNYHHAPESFSAGTINHLNDIWSFGLLLLEIVVDRSSYSDQLVRLLTSFQRYGYNERSAKTWNDFIEKLINDSRAIPKNFKPILTKMLEPNPSNRPNASELYHLLQ